MMGARRLGLLRALGTASKVAPGTVRKVDKQHSAGSQPCGIPVAVVCTLLPSY